MAKNIGKIFEEQLKKSVPEYDLIYRLPDSAQSFGGASSLRFSAKNPFDFLLWDSKRRILYAIEAKTVADKSISFEKAKEEQGEIHYHQIKGLNNWNKYDGVVCGFVIEFRKLETTIFIEISEFNKLIELIPKKSFTLKDLDEYNINYTIINQTKKRTRYLYDLEGFLNKAEHY